MRAEPNLFELCQGAAVIAGAALNNAQAQNQNNNKLI